VDWLRRTHRASDPATAAPAEVLPEPVERPTPGVAALLEGVSEDRSHAVLDLGPASAASLRVYSRFARRIRFADLLTPAMSPEGCAEALEDVPAQPDRPYDLVFAWDVLDRLFPEERPRLVKRLAELGSADARLHVVTEASGRSAVHPLRFSLLDVDRMRHEVTGPARPTRRQLLPAELERLLAPFQVVHAFTLKGGLREYVAIRQGAVGPRREVPPPYS